MDTGKWCLLMIFREIFEISLQTQALLIYNGTNIFDKNNVYLANEPRYIKVFAIFLFSNCTTCGILWLFYAFKPKLCYGLLFELILYCLDAIFDIFYAIFPFIIVFTSVNLRRSSGSCDYLLT